MGQYRISFYFKWQIGISACVETRFNLIEIQLPFFEICIGLDKTASGIYLFGKELNAEPK